MRFSKIVTVLVGAVFLNVLIATSSVQAQSDPPSTAKIEELIKLMKLDTQITAMMPVMKKQVGDLLRQLAPGITDEHFAVALQAISEQFDRMPSIFVRFVAPIYQKHLSRDDVDALIVFYKSPAGRSIVEKMPMISQESQVVAVEIGKRLGEQAFEEAKKRLRSKGYQL